MNRMLSEPSDTLTYSDLVVGFQGYNSGDYLYVDFPYDLRIFGYYPSLNGETFRCLDLSVYHGTELVTCDLLTHRWTHDECKLVLERPGVVTVRARLGGLLGSYHFVTVADVNGNNACCSAIQ